MEFMARRALDRWFGWVSYTLSKSERATTPPAPKKAETSGTITTSTKYILTVLGGYRLPRDFEVSGRFQYVTGNPYTPSRGHLRHRQPPVPPLPRSRPQHRPAAPTRLDLRIDKLYTFKRWQLELFVDLLNVYRGENPEQLQYNYDGTEFEYVSGLPFVPSLGFQVDVNF